jgi:hypothetical protein
VRFPDVLPTRDIPEWYVRSSIAPSTGRETGRVVTGVDEIPWGNVRHITPQRGLENPNAPMFASASVLCIPGQRTAVHIEGERTGCRCLKQGKTRQDKAETGR